MLEAYHKRHPKPKTIAEVKEVLQVIWDSLPQGPIDKAVKDFSKRLKAYVAAEGGHFEVFDSNCNVATLLLLLERCYFTS